jgi:hypothetical protein
VRAVFSTLAFFALSGLAQSPPPPATVPAAPPAQSVAPAQPPPAPPAPDAPPKPVVYNYTGKPIQLDAPCGDAEMQEYGLACSIEEPCRVYLELASVAAAGQKIFVAGNFHTESATLWSVLLMSDDAGHTWSEPNPRLRGVALDQMQFVTLSSGFVSGHTAGALPRDPFLLRTTDGGVSWQRITMFEDGAVGLIESFDFATATQGLIYVNRGKPGAGRFVTLETTTGGDSWITRSSAARRSAPAAQTAVSAWRLHADSATRSFRVELRQNSGWHAAAAFLIESGACRPIPKPPVVEPPEVGGPPGLPR